MTDRLARGEQEKDAEREVDARHHLLIEGVVRFPSPTARPHEHQRAERDANAPERDE